MLRKTVVLLASALLLSTSTTWAASEDNHHSGQSCQPSTSSDRGRIIYNSAGAQNNSTDSVRVLYCPNAWTGAIASQNSISAIVSYHDRSTTDSLSCRLELVATGSGATIVGPTVHSCASSVGCSNANPSFITENPRSLHLSLPHPEAVAPLSWAIRCTIPRRSKIGLSGILYYVIRHEPTGF